ncbi:lasso RiPP family leader peptide-containing protein [Streptomyces blastmyceticus]|uniref:Lasso RiPP family leader peptide-containing protein n=1 Tax=Streptomyces blastmyceticus TaxID=68180 RepID=A0ABP3G6X6_9ACTN
MEQREEVYEPPELMEVGDFAELTLGTSTGTFFEGGYAPWYVRPS